ncbi:MAG TPA: hypothetical protein DCZ92_02285 [Elusimicrobia bacterium]|nr:MAG: hypothetical protein A2016_03495 [Elusimicrobia bacterium GWF2_62_30]HBA59654.1 hypothetical protein [Elusimicrobiota bacterium]
MISFFAKYKRLIFGTVVVVFIGSMFFVSGQVFSTKLDSVAEVGGKKISYQRFTMQVNRAMSGLKDSGSEVNELMSRTVKQEIFREMVIEELLSQQGKELGLYVPDFEIAAEIQNTPQFREGAAFSPRAYYQTIYREFQMSPPEYEEWRKQARLASKFKQFIYTAVKVTPAEAKEAYQAAGKNMKDFEKNRAAFSDELARAKFANIANYLLRQLTVRQEVKSYLEEREQGK